MLESIQSLLDNFPEGIVHIRQNLVLSANAMAKHYLPQLTEGAPVPDCVVLPKNAPSGAGCFTSGAASYTFSCSLAEGDQLLFFRPAPQSSLTDRQLEGALEQLRGLLGEFLAEVGPLTQEDAPSLSLPSSAFSKPSAAKSSSSKRPKRDSESSPTNPQTFTSALNWTNPGGWNEPDRTLNDPGFSLGSFSPFLGTSSKLGFDSTSRMGVLSPPPQFDSLLMREGEREDGNRASNLYNRMISAPTNSIGFGNLLSPNGMKTKEPIFDGGGEIFQKDNSLCFPCSFDTQV